MLGMIALVASSALPLFEAVALAVATLVLTGVNYVAVNPSLIQNYAKKSNPPHMQIFFPAISWVKLVKAG